MCQFCMQRFEGEHDDSYSGFFDSGFGGGNRFDFRGGIQASTFADPREAARAQEAFERAIAEEEAQKAKVEAEKEKRRLEAVRWASKRAEGAPIPVTVFSGFLGSGKTTMILSLLKRLPKGYNMAILKNEFGDVAVDSELVALQSARAQSTSGSNIAVTEMLNGCLCCVLTGQVSDALKELRDLYNPDRILVETSGSAFPAPLALQIREMEGDGFKLDGIVNVLDCANFKGYEDTSYTAKVQCRYTDLLLLTKWEAVTERQLDTVLDSVYTLYDGTVVPVPPIIKVSKTGGLCPDVVFGLDTALFSELEAGEDGVMVDSEHHAREVDIIQVIRNLSGKMERKECGVEGCDARGVTSHQHEHHGHSHHHEEHGHDARGAEPDLNPLDRASFDAWLGTLSKDDVYRVKGLVRFDTGLEILNWAFGNWEYTKVPATEKWDDVISRITVMGRGLKMHLPGVRDGFKAGEGECWLVPAEVQ